MPLMIIPGLISLVFGLVFMWAPNSLTMKQRPPNVRTWFETDALFLEHRICVGICLIVVGVFCLLSAVYVWMRLTL